MRDLYGCTEQAVPRGLRLVDSRAERVLLSGSQRASTDDLVDLIAASPNR